MFFRRKKRPNPSLANVVTTLIFSNIPKSRGYDFDLIYQAALQAAELGAGIGAQFPEKGIPIFQQSYGEKAESIFQGSIEKASIWLDEVKNQLDHLTLENLPMLKPYFEEMQQSLPYRQADREVAVRIIRMAFLYSCNFGAVHRDICLRLLSAHLEKQSTTWELLKGLGEPLPVDLAETASENLEEVLQLARELVENYESDFGPLVIQ